MELYYDFLGIYGTRKQKIQDASMIMEEHVASGYFETDEISALCKQYNVVIMFQVEQDDGVCECYVINNLGDKSIYLTFSLEELYRIQDELRQKGVYGVFDEEQAKRAFEHMNDMNISEEEFIEENVDGFLLDMYDTKKESIKENLSDYYIKKTA